MNKPSTRMMATLTAGLGLVAAVTVSGAASAQAEPAVVTVLTGAAPVGEERSAESPPLGWRPLFEAVATGFEAVDEPVSTLGKRLVGKGRLHPGVRELLPEEVVTFYAGLTDEDKQVIKDLAAKHSSYETEDQALDALKAKSPKLHEKAVHLRELVKEKMAALTPEAREFVTGVVEQVRALTHTGDGWPGLVEIQQMGGQVLERYEALSDAAKANLRSQFPGLDAVSQMVRERLD